MIDFIIVSALVYIVLPALQLKVRIFLAIISRVQYHYRLTIILIILLLSTLGIQ